MPRRGSRVRFPSRALKKETDWWNTNRSLFFEPCRGSKFDVSAPLRSSQTNVPRTLCDVSRSILHKRVRISPAGSVGAKQVPLAPSAPSRASVVIVLTVSPVGARKFDVSAPLRSSQTNVHRTLCDVSRFLLRYYFTILV